MSAREQRHCTGCGISFVPNYPDHRYHSRACWLATDARPPIRMGTANNRFNGGLSLDRRSGRWKIMCRDGTQLWYYRGVMAAEVGRLLRPDELVHHINEDTLDDRPENLVITTRSEHGRHHTTAQWRSGARSR